MNLNMDRKILAKWTYLANLPVQLEFRKKTQMFTLFYFSYDNIVCKIQPLTDDKSWGNLPVKVLWTDIRIPD